MGIGPSGTNITVSPGTYYLTFSDCMCQGADGYNVACAGRVSPGSVTVSAGGTVSATVIVDN